jgi:hypothetical protein
MAAVFKEVYRRILDTDLCTCGHFYKAHRRTSRASCSNCPRLKKKQKCTWFTLVEDNLTYIEVLAKKRNLI